jgi:trans-2,3-dihydro-3-hydroxyanthranilate isomerase
MVDVFAEEKLEGNQLAVIIDEGLSMDKMQQIAKEFNFSETAFITSVDKENHIYGVRIFTPESELPFAGHPTLGTAYIIQQVIIGESVEEIILVMKAGEVPVKFTYTKSVPDLLWMKQMEPIFGKKHDPKPFTEILGLKTEEIDSEYPIQEVSTGLPFFIIPLRTRKAVSKTTLDVDKLKAYTEKTDAKWPLVFCKNPENPGNHLKARVITTFTEDPATGSANGCLAAYLVKHRYFDSLRIDIRVEQGAEVGRPSILYLRADEKPDGIIVHVGGKVTMVAKGKLLLHNSVHKPNSWLEFNSNH